MLSPLTAPYVMINRWLEAVPNARIPIYVALIHNDKTERFCILQTCRDFTKDSCETRVIFWRVIVVSGGLF